MLNTSKLELSGKITPRKITPRVDLRVDAINEINKEMPQNNIL